MASVSRQYKYTSELEKEQPGDEKDDVLFASLYGVRTVELNRPKKLNSLNGSMARKILPRLREWEKSQMANVILMTGAGPKALCAGGDVAELAKNNATAEGRRKSTDYFALEYMLDHLIATYSKPYIAVMDGITMGGGVGLSVHAPFRLATEKTTFAMPETKIGFFPDVGGSFFLSRLDGEIGTYLALTSERLQGVQTLYAGIATHYLDSSVLQPLTTRLSELSFRDHAPLSERLDLVQKTLSEFTTDLPSPDSYSSAPTGNISGELRDAVDRCFSFNTIPEILNALETEASSSRNTAKWAQNTIKAMSQRSPTSLKVTLRQLRLGKGWSISETFIREHEMAARFMQHPDFTEGVSALLINKPATDPKWQPSKLEEVGRSDIESFFKLPEGVEPMKLLEPVQGAMQDYREYPWARFALPRESEISTLVAEYGKAGEQYVLEQAHERWHGRPGVKEKVADFIARKTEQRGTGIALKQGGKPSL